MRVGFGLGGDSVTAEKSCARQGFSCLIHLVELFAGDTASDDMDEERETWGGPK